VETVKDVCADIRKQTVQQEADQIANAKSKGIEFFKLSDAEMAILKKQADKVHDEFREEINKLYPGDTYRPADFLGEVQKYIGYK
jgi:hypothetical protein